MTDIPSQSCLSVVSFALSYFLPIILADGMGFSVGASQCLVAPPYALGAVLAWASSWCGDKYKTRGPVLMVNTIICLVGLPIMGFAKGNGIRYFGVFFTTAGATANVPTIMAYQANNIRKQWKRALSSATLVAFSGMGGVASTLVFRPQDAPQYTPGIYACIA